MPIDEGKLRDYFGKLKFTEAQRLELQEKLDKLGEAADQRDRDQREALTTCRCHAGGHCVFHTQYM